VFVVMAPESWAGIERVDVKSTSRSQFCKPACSMPSFQSKPVCQTPVETERGAIIPTRWRH